MFSLFFIEVVFPSFFFLFLQNFTDSDMAPQLLPLFEFSIRFYG